MNEGRLLELRFPALAGELKSVRQSVQAALERAGLPAEGCRDVVMAIDEACQNVIRHAYGPERAGDVRIVIELADGALVVELTDWAPPTDPARVRPRALDDVRPGGLGTHLIAEVMDSVAFVNPPPGCGNLLRMVKRLAQ